MTRYRTTDGKEDMKQKVHWFGAAAIPLAFMNGLFFGGYACVKSGSIGKADQWISLYPPEFNLGSPPR